MGTRTQLGLAAAALVLVAVCAVILIAKPFSASSSAQVPEKLSIEAKVYLQEAMPKLQRITEEYNAGDTPKAVRDWKSLGSIPMTNAADQAVSADYLAYANNVRYYMVGDGSVTLKQLEASREKARQTIAAYR
jgi:hypothetical protein